MKAKRKGPKIVHLGTIVLPRNPGDFEPYTLDPKKRPPKKESEKDAMDLVREAFGLA